MGQVLGKMTLATELPHIEVAVISIVVLMGVVIVGGQLYKVFIYPLYISPLRALPGPQNNKFFLGQSLKFARADWLPNVFCEWSLEHPDAPFIRYLNFANTETLIVNNMAAYKEILQIKANLFVKPALARNFAHETIGDGLPFIEGPLHKLRRASLRKPFAIPQLRNFFPKIQAKAKQLGDVLAENRGHFDCKVDIESQVWKAVLDVIGLEALGIDFDNLRHGTSLFDETFAKTMQPSFFGHAINYFNSSVPIRKYLPFKECREHVRLTSATRSFIRDHVRDRAFISSGEGEKKPTENKDILQYMLEHADAGWGENEIVEYTLNLLVLGHETTACSITWAIHELSRNPEYQQRLRAEVEEMHKQYPNAGYNEIDKLPFLNNFVRETLRLYCAVALAPREATADVTIVGVAIPKGTILQLSPAVMNLHPSIWGPTASKFDPDRWDNRTGDAASAYAFETFHNGPRMCIGRQLTLIEMKTFLVEIVHRFRVGCTMVQDGKKLEVAGPSFTLRPKDKLVVSLENVVDGE